MLHHYTNAAGLQGILASGHIWLSDTFRMNDPSEVEHGFSIATERLSNCATATRPETEYFARGFEAFLSQGGVKASGHFFSASFSGDGDDLGQWRAYGDNGRGFALWPLMARRLRMLLPNSMVCRSRTTAPFQPHTMMRSSLGKPD